MSIFEIIMLVCFGAGWPFAVIKTYRTKSVKGKSRLFLTLVFFGYIAGIFHKLVYNFDYVIFLYAFNGLLVFADLVLCFRYKNIETTLNPV